MTTLSAAFLDRDGTVMRDVGYPRRPSDVELLPGAAAGIARLNAADVPVVLVTNQSGIGRGLLTEADFEAVQEALRRRLAAEGARWDAVYHCPHDPDRETCGCRKPAGGLFERAARELDLRLERSLFVGDRMRDLRFGMERGGRAFLLADESAGGTPEPGVATAPDLATAIARTLAEVRSPA
ncbi:MAG: HAD family hydrolase [Gemmatimonadota bacterium]|nr:HAD family hydrolase [Gemmatimonadota bacterium]